MRTTVQHVRIEDMEFIPTKSPDALVVVLHCLTSNGKRFETAFTANPVAHPNSREARHFKLIEMMLASWDFDERDTPVRASWSRLLGCFFKFRLKIGDRPRPTDADPKPRRPVYIEKFKRAEPFAERRKATDAEIFAMMAS